jgi:hypothetical protein
MNSIRGFVSGELRPVPQVRPCLTGSMLDRHSRPPDFANASAIRGYKPQVRLCLTKNLA